MVKKSHIRFLILLFLGSITGMLFSCKNKTYNYNNGVIPNGISFTNYYSGTGTSLTEGAIIVNVYSNSTNINYEYYVVSIYGVGTYTMQTGTKQLFIPYVWANTYDISVEKICAAGTNTGCNPRIVIGSINITTQTTTVANAYL
ncbi:hypothetical protein [Cytophaga hutchinsonii]|jgi:hypothetical protein|uniref:Lipoprotein n=1 Tax=Cytophaga hutchinsonii (strain ATCC 33406 / DSM 1761 / CIP 103989 / NBRC 15051 / NCIMB 9469 / D465) TaxID=269798 RepID=A0A6N4STE9_CYTH3|nr:hypothetical protein [Cytophaga hutchinsonii]ABG59719.1 hypothetical protein CHU_2465 [Cytophaga hutchinsonii ATCC 33406]SFX65445.1 hypothetical protein SAMN04487930_10768 [Cytophaga hutchinsonii ATCC 33406]